MQINVSEVEYCKLNVEFEADKETIDVKFDNVISNFKSAPVPGFRKGRATKQALMYHYKDQINDSVKRSLAEDAFHETLFSKNVKPLSQPTFSSIVLRDGRFSCAFSFYKKPEFELHPYKEYSFPKPKEERTTLDLVASTLEDLRSRFGESIPFEDTDQVMDGDNVIIDYDCIVDGEKDDKLSAVGELLVVGKSKLKFFDDQIIGMKNGEERSFELNQDVGHLNPRLTGKNIKFNVTLRMGSKMTPCALDDALAVRLGFETFNDLHKAVLNNSERVMSDGAAAKEINLISYKLIEDNVFKVPDNLILAEARYLAASQNVVWEQLTDNEKENFLANGERSVRLHLILDRIREEDPETQLTDEDALNIVKKNFNNGNDGTQDVDKAIKELSDNGGIPILIARVRDHFTLEFIKSKSTWVE